MLDISLIIQMFALLNPLSSIGLLVAAHKSKQDTKEIALRSTIAAFIIAVVFLFLGPALFNVFGISTDSFRVAGGVVLFLLGLNMARPPKKEIKEFNSVDGLITVLATPMLTGPATISFITLKSYEIGQVAVLFNIVPTFILVGAVMYLIAMFVSKINLKLVDMFSRILGLFLIAVSVEMVAKGIIGLFG